MKRSVILTAAAALVLAGCTATPQPVPADDEVHGTLTVFAAASLTETFDALAARFEADHPGVEVVLSYGGSSSLATQIAQGAPADVFAAANESTMESLVDAGDAGPATVFATNTLVLITPAGNPAGVTGLADLADPGLAIALCDPGVPCGSAAQALLAEAGVTAVPDTLEQDVKAVLTKVELGEADAGLVYVTDARATGSAVEVIDVPEAQQVINRYPIAVLTAAPNPDAARAWVELVLSGEGQAVLSDAGFLAP
jgi:molybdate transport system substrate-binding protein